MVMLTLLLDFFRQFMFKLMIESERIDHKVSRNHGPIIQKTFRTFLQQLKSPTRKHVYSKFRINDILLYM
jgi:coenzyme F420-reducing hydrogenase delta subunit